MHDSSLVRRAKLCLKMPTESPLEAVLRTFGKDPYKCFAEFHLSGLKELQKSCVSLHRL